MYQLWPQAKVPSCLILIIFVVKSTMFLGIRNIHLILRKYHYLSSLPPHSLHFSFYLGPAYFFFKKYLFIWLCWVLGSSLHHVGFFIVVHGLSVCGEGTSCFEAHVILVPQPGIEPASPALQCGFLITGASPGKSPPYSL